MAGLEKEGRKNEKMRLERQRGVAIGRWVYWSEMKNSPDPRASSSGMA